MNTEAPAVLVVEDEAAAAAGVGDTERRLAKMMQIKRYVVRHRCGQPVRVYLTRRAAQGAADGVPSPDRHGLRVAVATRADMLATLTQRHCPHIVIAAAA